MKHKSYISAYLRLCQATVEFEYSSFHFEIIKILKVLTLLQNHFYLFKSSIEAGMKISKLLFCHGKKGGLKFW